MATPYSLKKKQQIQKAMEQALSAAASKPATQGTPFASAATEAAYAASNPSYKVPIETTTTKKVAGATKNVSQEKKDKVYSSFPGYTKKRAEETKAEAEKAKSAVEEAEGEEFDWTDANQRKQHEDAVKQKKVESAKADEKARQAEENAVYAADMAEIDSLSEEEKEALDDYKYYAAAKAFAEAEGTETPIGYKKRVQSLIDKYGEERAAELYDTYAREKGKEEAEKEAERAKNLATEKPVFANLAATGARLVEGLATPYSLFEKHAQDTGRYQTLSPYTSGDWFNVFAENVRAQTAEDIKGEDNGVIKNATATLYQVGTNVVDNLLRAFAFGKGSIGVQGVQTRLKRNVRFESK